MCPPFTTIINLQIAASCALLDRREGTYLGDHGPPPSARFFLYPVHVSMAFLLTRGLASALYLLLLRLLNRDYASAFRLCDSVASDTRLAPDELTAFNALKGANDDWAPDAHAVRLKVALVTADTWPSLAM